MMIIAAFATGLVLMFVIWAPRILVASIVAFCAVMLARTAQRSTRSMLANAPRDLNYDRKPSRAQLRLMRASLRVALDQTELRSLFPTMMGHAERWTVPIR